MASRGFSWDSYSPLDYPDDFTEAEVTIKLSEETIEQLRELAQDKGIGPTTLARMWIPEHLKAEGKQPSGGRRS